MKNAGKSLTATRSPRENTAHTIAMSGSAMMSTAATMTPVMSRLLAQRQVCLALRSGARLAGADTAPVVMLPGSVCANVRRSLWRRG